MQVLNAKIIIHAARTDVWKVFSDPTTWEIWYGGRLLSVAPAWQTGATLMWELGRPSSLRDVRAPERVVIQAENGLTTWKFSEQQGQTLVEMEQDFRGSGLVVSDTSRLQRQCNEEVQGLKRYVEKAYPVKQLRKSGTNVSVAKERNKRKRQAFGCYGIVGSAAGLSVAVAVAIMTQGKEVVLGVVLGTTMFLVMGLPSILYYFRLRREGAALAASTGSTALSGTAVMDSRRNSRRRGYAIRRRAELNGPNRQEAIRYVECR